MSQNTVYPLKLNELKTNPLTTDNSFFIINASAALTSFVIYMIIYRLKLKRWII
jgi:hypothetical protein